jgi:hypothetical protein
MICKFYAMLHRLLEHLWVLFAGRFGTNPPFILIEGTLFHFQTTGEFLSDTVTF